MIEEDYAYATRDNDLLDTTDAQIWAERFVERAAENPNIPLDAGAMGTWFACAIESARRQGRDEAKAKYLAQLADARAVISDTRGWEEDDADSIQSNAARAYNHALLKVGRALVGIDD